MRARTGVAILIVAAIAAAAVPQVTGRMTESRVRDLVASFNKGGFYQGGTAWKATIASYDRSWTRSSSVVRFGFGDGSDVAEVRTTWRHGPLAGLNLASGSSELRLAGTLSALGSVYLGGAAPATATHTVALDGSLRVALTTPAVDRSLPDAKSARVSATESSGTLSIDRSGRYVLAHRLPRFTVSDGADMLEIDTVELASAGRFGDAAFQSPAQFSLSVKSIRWGDRARSMSIADASLTGRMIPNAESIDIKAGYVVGPGHVDAVGNIHRWRKIEIQVTLADISRAAIEGFSREMQSVADLPESDPRRLKASIAAFDNAREALLKREPTFSLDTFTFDGPDGALKVSATARIDRARLADGGPDALPAAIAVLAQVSIARALAEAWLGAVLRPYAVAVLTAEGAREPPAADVDRWSRTMAGNVLVAAAQAGLFREGADPIVIEIVAKDGRVLANGLSPERIAELREALMPAPPRSRTIGVVPPVTGSR